MKMVKMKEERSTKLLEERGSNIKMGDGTN